MMKAIQIARHALSFSMTRAEVAEHMIEQGFSVEDTFLAMGAAQVLNRDYTPSPALPQNRSEHVVIIPGVGARDISNSGRFSRR